MAVVRKVASDRLTSEEVRVLRDLFRAAWSDDPEPFTDDDWEHAIGGVHFLLEDDSHLLAHASVVEREIHVGPHRLATGYVEAVATWPVHQRRGHGSALMRQVGAFVDRTFQLGALGGTPAFYERLGWVVWRGPTFVRRDSELIRTAEDDGFVLVRLTPTSPELDPSAPISCDWRPGDVW